MTEAAMSAGIGIKPDTASIVSNVSDASSTRMQLFELAVWVLRIVAVSVVLWAASISALNNFDIDQAHFAIVVYVVLGTYFLAALIASASVWMVDYVSATERQDFDFLFLQAVLGKLSLYGWFVFAVLYTGGVGTALWHAKPNQSLQSYDFFSGVGWALAALTSGAALTLFAPKSLIRYAHMVGTVFAGAALALAYSFWM